MVRYILPLLVLCGTSSLADSHDPGHRLFQLHCAVCHGADARGTGSMADALTVVPADLTILQKQNNGIFPTARVVAQIDGRASLPGHGSNMPVYGWFFEGPKTTMMAGDGQTLEASAAIADIVRWLLTIQSSR
ncbi:c-type cytochrome [Roseobacter weihaiensis]|uniref:c-type cytochrome n=1 Tax=Roseobacter weihaiensis TaxID=2763262 RepID=UPI001D0B2959|nr:cytochrome c [Roseobacter sp. H9]